MGKINDKVKIPNTGNEESLGGVREIVEEISKVVEGKPLSNVSLASCIFLEGSIRQILNSDDASKESVLATLGAMKKDMVNCFEQLIAERFADDEESNQDEEASTEEPAKS